MDCKFIIWVLFIVSLSSIPQCNPSAVMDKGKAMKFLKNYGYLPQTDLETGFLRSEDEVKNAIMDMQRMAALPVTGVLDNDTLTKMASPRCGMYDVEIHTSKRMKRYVLASKWETKELTWRLEKGSSRLTDSVVRETVKQAMKIWSDVSQLTFIEQPGSSDVDMKIRFGRGYHGDGYPFDSQGGVLAHAFYPSPGWGGDLHFDDAESWTVSSPAGQNLLYVAVHELGHALGLRHSNVADSIMYPYARGYDPNLKLYPDDIAGIQALYGKPSEPQTTPGTSTAKTTSTTTTSTSTVPPTEPPTRPGHCPMKIDALSVIRGETFIFNGTDYLRYNNYGMVGDKAQSISDFWVLPEDVTNIDAAYMRPQAGGYRIVFFSGRRLFEFDGTLLTSTKTLTDIGIPSDVDHIDAAFVWSLNDMTYLVCGSMYWRYNDVTKSVFPDYPKDMKMWGGVPVPVDSAFSAKDRDGVERTYFFSGMDFYELENDVMQVRSQQRPPTVQFWRECFASIHAEVSSTMSVKPVAVTLLLLLTILNWLLCKQYFSQ